MKKDINVLIVEDSKYMNSVILKTAQDYGYNCKSVFTYEEAQKLLEKELFDFIILDLNLPDKYGMDLVLNIMGITDAKIFILTSEVDIELREALFRKGILDYLIKDKHFIDSIGSINHTIHSLPYNAAKNILVIDDSKFICHEISKVLGAREYNVIAEYSAKEGIERLMHDDIHTIILDMELPDKNGLDVLRELGKNEKTKDIPVIVLSATADNEVVRNCIKLGSSDFVKKPFNIEEFVLKVSQAVTVHSRFNELKLIQEKLEKDLGSTSFIAEEYREAINESNILVHTNEHFIINDVNDRYCDVSGLSRDKILSQKFSYFISKETRDKVSKEISIAMKNKEIWRGEVSNLDVNDSIYYTETSVMPIFDKNGDILEYLWMSTDITKVVKAAKDMQETQRELLYTMGEIGESRSQETGQHVKRVAYCTRLLAELHGMDAHDIESLYHASPMHDIGKVAIPDNILKKPAKLNADEWKVMQTHAQLGADVFKNSDKEIFKVASVVALTHHEKWDGTGYPNGTKGKNIPIFGRITAIADVFDALSSKRVYKDAWPDEDVRSYFEEKSGTQFDPKLTKLFLENYESFLAIRDAHKDVE